MIYTTTLIELCCVGAALFITSNAWFYFRVLRPIRRLAGQANQLSQGQLDSFNQQCGGIDEVQALRRALAGMVGHVRRAQEQGRAYSEQLAHGQEVERKRIAQELHDDTVQSVIAITQAIDLAKRFAHTDATRAEQMLQTARQQAVDVVARLRDMIGGLRPPALEELGFIPALQMQLESVNGADVTLTVNGSPRRLDEAYELALFRAAQEALQNAVRHGQAKRIVITVSYQPDGVTLRIDDDGVGFAPPDDLGELALKRHYGLVGIQERAVSLGGALSVTSRLGSGTTLEISLPTTAQQQPDHLVQDPVCSAWIEPQRAYGSVTHNDETYYFCCPVCQGAFQKEPDVYL